MSTLDGATSPTHFGLLRAAEAVTNWRALTMCACASLATTLSGLLTMHIQHHSTALGLLFAIATLVVGLVGYCAVGVVLMCSAQGQPVRLVDALLQAVFTTHRLIGIGFLLCAGWLILILAILLVFFVCKIPGIGPLLYAIAYPLTAVLAGMAFAGMGCVCYPLAAPAVWQGNSTLQTMARLMHICRQQLISVIVKMLGLLFLVGILSGVVFAILSVGIAITSSISAATGISPVRSLIGTVPGFGGLDRYGMAYGFGANSMTGALGTFGDAAGHRDTAYVGSFGFGTGLLIAIGFVIPFLTFLNGCCLIYLQTAGDTDFSAAEEKLRERVAQAKRQAKQAREHAAERLARSSMAHADAKEPHAPTEASADKADNKAADGTCSRCHMPMASDDQFCGECGAPRGH
ncbi:hypothetical protein DFQ28_004396 [Apophysomyces sp. BC1034]|nr:hypothetical protein DFQ30_001374 [Apophysomyces sp. BC1015]KAG0188743.1 hypothetical protein DFQ28_004396 [Apophysomyces sp. BC1034]